MILWTFIKLPFVIKNFVLPIFEWPLYTGFTIHYINVGQDVTNKGSYFQSLSGMGGVSSLKIREEIQTRNLLRGT